MGDTSIAMSTPTGPSGADLSKGPVIDGVQYPVQRHAGKVGYGPNYNVGASIGDRMSGLVEELRGKMTHNPELVHHGHEKYSGELKRKEVLGMDSDDPLSGRKADDINSEPGSSEAKPSGSAINNQAHTTVPASKPARW